jgi:hypothetical protein
MAFLGAAAIAGSALGVASLAAERDGLESLRKTAKSLSVSAGLARERAPRTGDHWSRCDDARAIGTAPIYIGEPGYREGLDRDGDGIACEPNPGMH